MMSLTSEVASSSSAYSTDSLKRQREGDSCELEIHPCKKPWYIYIPESTPALSGDESVHSMQEWETEFCQDTPDTSTDTSSDTDFVKDSHWFEFDVASLSETENPFGSKGSGSSDSSTEDGDQTRVTEIVVEVEKEEAIERECWGDDSDLDTYSASSDQELSQSDFWTCLRCKCINKPIPRFCIKCFQVRKNWFPPRPRRKLKKKKKSLQMKRNNSYLNHSKDGEDSGMGSFSNGTKDVECSLKINGEIKSSELASEKSRESNKNTDGTGVVSALKSDNCIICMQEPKNAVFVHGTIGHLCCCYPCAKKVWSSSGKCPVCNRKSNCVVKIFVA